MMGVGYRYGFQAQEMDNEVKGTGNSINYKFRMHDPRVGRFFAVDPLIKDYPFYSSYAFSGNRVIDSREIEGLEPKQTVEDAETGDVLIEIPAGDKFEVPLHPGRAPLGGPPPASPSGGSFRQRMETLDYNMRLVMRSNPLGFTQDSELTGTEGARKVAEFESKLGTGLMFTPLAPFGTVIKGKSVLMFTFIDIEDEEKSAGEIFLNAGIRSTTFFGGKFASGLIRKEVTKGVFQEGRKQAMKRAVDGAVSAGGDVVEDESIKKTEQMFIDQEEENQQ